MAHRRNPAKAVGTVARRVARLLFQNGRLHKARTSSDVSFRLITLGTVIPAAFSAANDSRFRADDRFCSVLNTRDKKIQSFRLCVNLSSSVES